MPPTRRRRTGRAEGPAGDYRDSGRAVDARAPGRHRPQAGGGRRVPFLERRERERPPPEFLLTAADQEHDDDRDRIDPQRVDRVEVEARPEQYHVDDAGESDEDWWQNEREGVPSRRDADPQVRPQPRADAPFGHLQGDERPGEWSEPAEPGEHVHRRRREDPQ
jgi:hypothetical protein